MNKFTFIFVNFKTFYFKSVFIKCFFMSDVKIHAIQATARQYMGIVQANKWSLCVVLGSAYV